MTSACPHLPQFKNVHVLQEYVNWSNSRILTEIIYTEEKSKFQGDIKWRMTEKIKEIWSMTDRDIV